VFASSELYLVTGGVMDIFNTEKELEHEVDREEGSHGSHWSTMHGGYFSDPQIAKTLLDPVMDRCRQTNPDVIVDMGGGTGFLLDQLVRHGIAPEIRLVNLDLSDAQLEQISNPRIEPVRESILTFSRSHLTPKDKKILWMTRSTLHYAGIFGMHPWLEHVRKQLRDGEYFIHQSACFAKMEDSLCLSELYERMQSEKWYPTIEVVERAMRETGFVLEAVFPAPSLELTSAALSARYHISEHDMAEISEALGSEYGPLPGTFEPHPSGFISWLHYRVFVCRAV